MLRKIRLYGQLAKFIGKRVLEAVKQNPLLWIYDIYLRRALESHELRSTWRT